MTLHQGFLGKACWGWSILNWQVLDQLCVKAVMPELQRICTNNVQKMSFRNLKAGANLETQTGARVGDIEGRERQRATAEK